MRRFISEENAEAKELSLWRSLSVISDSRPATVEIDGRKYLNFSTNDYLGYSHHPDVIRSAKVALERYGTGGRSSRLISGTLDLHRDLEERLARFKGTESALLFPTGYMANLGIVSALLGEGDAIIMDRLNHASLIDAARLARCRMFVYEHASPASLKKILDRTRSYHKRLVATDSLFSMDGDLAPLNDIFDLCQRNGVWLMIDDAHATGVLGENGTGLAEHCNLLGKVQIVMGTLSKALGSQGGFVCGTKEFIDFLINRARPFIYTTALSPASCGAAMAAMDLVKKEPWRRSNLLESSRNLRNRLKRDYPEASITISDPATPVIPFRVGTAERAVSLSRSLHESGIYVPAIRPPTVPKGECRVRISLSSEHSAAEIDRLVQALAGLHSRQPQKV